MFANRCEKDFRNSWMSIHLFEMNLWTTTPVCDIDGHRGWSVMVLSSHPTVYKFWTTGHWDQNFQTNGMKICRCQRENRVFKTLLQNPMFLAIRLSSLVHIHHYKRTSLISTGELWLKISIEWHSSLSSNIALILLSKYLLTEEIFFLPTSTIRI